MRQVLSSICSSTKRKQREKSLPYWERMRWVQRAPCLPPAACWVGRCGNGGSSVSVMSVGQEVEVVVLSLTESPPFLAAPQRPRGA
jgi:hypothetical protein